MDQRFLLANERTSWPGVGVEPHWRWWPPAWPSTQLLDRFDLPGGRRLFGLPLILLGGVIAWLSHRRSNQIEHALRQDLTLPPHGLPAILTATIITAAALSVLLATVGQPGRGAP